VIDYYDAIDLVMDALSELTIHECPFCNHYIGVDEYITEDDIRDWLRDRKDVIVVKAEPVED